MVKQTVSALLLCSMMSSFIFGDVMAVWAQDVRSRSKVAVFPFADTNQAAKETGYGDAIAGMLTTELIKGGVFQIIERKEIERIINELGLNQSGFLDSKTAKEIGNLYGLDMLVFGTVAKFSNLVETDCRLIDTQNGEAILADNASCRNESEIRNMVVNLARKMEQRFTKKETSQMIIHSIPSGAKVFIDGVSVGYTPLVKKMEYGAYNVEISLENYAPWTKEVLLDQAQTKVSAQLVGTKTETPSVIKKQGNKTWLYVVGGAALIGGGIAALSMGKEKKENKNSNVSITITIP